MEKRRDWLKDVKKFFSGNKPVVAAKDILGNKIVLKNPYGASVGANTLQKIAEAELASQSAAAAKKAKK